MTSTTSTTWTSIDNARTRRAAARLEAFLDEPGYEVSAGEPDGEEVFAPHVLLMPDVDVVVGAGLTVEAARRDAAIEVGTGTLDLSAIERLTSRPAARPRGYR